MSYQQLPVSSEDDVFAAGQKGQYLLGVRRDSDTAAVVDGHLVGLAVDEEGRLKTSNKTGSFAAVTGSLTTSGTSVVVDVRRASNIVFHAKNTGTVSMAAGAFSFEASIDSTDGTNGTWFAIQAVQSSANTIQTATGTVSLAAGAGLTYSYEASVNAYQYARIRCTTSVTASSIATWTIQRGSYATEPIPASQAHSVTITGTSNAVNATPVAGGTVSTIVTAATTNAAVIKASAGSLYEITLSNITATPAFVKLYSKASAPTVGTDVPVVTLQIAANTTVAYEFGPIGKRFSAGIGIAVTGAAPATDTTAFVAGMQISATYL